MRWLLLLACTGCVVVHPSLLRYLQREQEEVQSARSAEMSCRSHTPDVSGLVGTPRKTLTAHLGRGDCYPLASGERCRYPFFANGPSQHGGPILRIDYDSQGVVSAARWDHSD